MSPQITNKELVSLLLRLKIIANICAMRMRAGPCFTNILRQELIVMISATSWTENGTDKAKVLLWINQSKNQSLSSGKSQHDSFLLMPVESMNHAGINK